MSNRTYDDIKRIVQIILPAFGSLFFLADAIWDVPIVTKTLGITALIALFLGLIIQIASKRYHSGDKPYSGDIVVTEGQNGSTLYSMELNEDPELIEAMDAVTFKVIRN